MALLQTSSGLLANQGEPRDAYAYRVGAWFSLHRSQVFRLSRVVVTAFVSCAILVLLALPARAEATDDDSDAREATLLFNAASRLYRQESWKEAGAAFGDFLTRFPQHGDAAEARFARGYCAVRLGNHAAAVADLRLACKAPAAPWRADAHFHLGRALESLAHAQVADRVRARHFEEAATHFASAAALRRAASAKAKSESERQRLRASFLQAWVAQGEALYRGGNPAAAEKALQPLLEGTPRRSSEFVRGVYFLALARHAQVANGGNVDGVLTALRSITSEVFVTDPLWEEAAFLEARLSHTSGRLPSAAELYDRLRRHGGSRESEAAYYRTLVDYAEGSNASLARAAREFAAFARQNAGHPLAVSAKVHEGFAYFNLGRFSDAATRLKPLCGSSSPLKEAETLNEVRLRFGQSLLLSEPPDSGAAIRVFDQILSSEPTTGPPSAAQASHHFDATFWKAEALLSSSDSRSCSAAAQLLQRVWEAVKETNPSLAEEALHKAGEAHYAAGELGRALQMAEVYQRTYAEPRGKFFPASLELAGRSALYAPPDTVPDPVRAEASRFFLRAAELTKDRGRQRALRYEAGVAHYHNGEFAAAAMVLEGVLSSASSPGERGQDSGKPFVREYPELRFYLADGLVQQRRGDGALSASERRRLQKAVGYFEEYLEGGSEKENAATARLHLAYCHHWLSDQKSAIAAFRAFLAAHGKHRFAPQARSALANAHLDVNEPEPALAEFRQLFGDGRGSDAALLEQAFLQVAVLERQLGEPRKAVRWVDQFLPRIRKRLSATILQEVEFHRAMGVLEAGEDKSARVALSEFLAAHPESSHAADVRVQLGHLELEDGDPQATLAAVLPLCRSSEAVEGRDQALYLQAWALTRLAAEAKDPTERQRLERDLVRAYESLLDEHPNSSLLETVRLEFGQHLFNRGDVTKAGEQFASLLESLENDPPTAGTTEPSRRELLAQGSMGLGFVHYEKKEFARARALFDAAAENASSEDSEALRVQATFRAAQAWMRSHGEKEAAERFRALAQKPTDAAAPFLEESLLRLGECLHRMQRYEEAIPVLKRCLHEFADGPLRHEVRFALGFAQQFANKFSDAIESYRRVTRESTAVVAARAQYHLGECYLDRGMIGEAGREFMVVVANFDLEGGYRDWFRRALLAAGIAFDRAGERSTAVAQWNELVRRFPDSDEGKAARARLGAK